MGPIQIMVFGFEDFNATGAIADELAALSDAGIITIIDARFLVKESPDSLVAVRASDLTDDERDDLRAAAGALVGLGAGAVLGGEGGAAAGAIFGAEEAYFAGPMGMSDEEIMALGDELAVGDALLLLVIENAWAAGLAAAIRDAGMVFGEANYLRPEGLVALGAMLGVEVALEEGA